MSRPSFKNLKLNYPDASQRESLFAEIGWDDLIPNPAYRDTCAIRMSDALLKAGVMLPGARMKAKSGAVRGRSIEPGQAKLSNILKKIWGAPEIYRNEATARAGIGKRSGVTSFFRISVGDGGHIDLIWMGEHGFQRCARSCYFSAMTVWFLPLR